MLIGLCSAPLRVQLRVPPVVHAPRPVGHRLRDHRRPDPADHPAEQVARAGARRGPARGIVCQPACACAFAYVQYWLSTVCLCLHTSTVHTHTRMLIRNPCCSFHRGSSRHSGRRRVDTALELLSQIIILDSTVVQLLRCKVTCTH